MTHQEYFDKLTDSIDTLSDILDTEHYGMCLVDKDGYIIKWYYEKFFNIKASAAVGRHVTEVIENTRLHVVAQTGVKELMQLQEINGSMVITNRIPLIHNHEVIGAAGTIIFRDIKEIAHLHSRMSKLEDNFKAYRSEIAKMYAAQYHFDDIITNNQKMLNLKHLGQTIARSDASVLIQGESGTGKELFAQAIHNASLVSHQPFVSLNCSSIPKELLEAELFGYESGAFTGARKDGKIGKFELAGEGTLFLDELGTMPMDMQVKLLRVLESKEYVPLGSNKKVPFKARVIAATNENLSNSMQNGSFRSDLYYRLNVININIPPLRERIEDLPVLCSSMLSQKEGLYHQSRLHMSQEAMDLLSLHNWPGNVRELRNCVMRTLAYCDGDIILPHCVDIGAQNEEKGDGNQNRTPTELLQKAWERGQESAGPAQEASGAASVPLPAPSQEPEKRDTTQTDPVSPDSGPCEAARRSPDTKSSSEEIPGTRALNSRMRAALTEILKRESLSRQDYQDIAGKDISMRTAQYDLQELVKAGFLRREGRGPALRYIVIRSEKNAPSGQEDSI